MFVNYAHLLNALCIVILAADESSLSVCVEDDGKGFDVREMLGRPTGARRGLGIVGMMERASLLGGKLAMHSVPGEGTRISARVPLRPLEDRDA